MLPYSILTFLVILTVQCALSVDQPPRVTRPPTIMPERQMQDVIYFDPEGTSPQEFPCKALGNETINFEWTKNGKVIDLDDPKYISNTTKKPKIVHKDRLTGTIVISELREDDEGIYQCIARNAYGVSKSKKFHLLKATKRPFSDPTKRTRYSKRPADFLMIRCNPPQNTPPGIIRWVQYSDNGNGKNYIDFGDRISQDNEGNLYFANVQEGDENEGEDYTCEVQIRALNMYIEGAFSTIEVDDSGPVEAQFPVELKYFSEPEVTGLKGKTVTFQCIFAGNPTPSIKWVRKSGGKLDKKRMFPKNQKLTIKNVQYEDAGTYECRGENSVIPTAIKKTFKLEVESKPVWVAEPKKFDAGVEEQAVFECSAEGRPEPEIQWFINGEPLENLKVDSRRIESAGQLRFMNLTRDDAKVIQCNVSNSHGSLWADVALSIMAYKPEIKAKFDEIKVSEGKSVTLPCEVDGKPTPSVFWKRKDQKMDGPGYRMMSTGNLTIENATKSEEGKWTCFAENRYGKTKSSGELIVRMKTKIENRPSPSKQQIKFGTTTPFRCNAITDPAEQQNLKYTWLKDGEPIDFKNNPRVKKTGTGIIVEGTTSEDTGNYTCVASNGLDSDSASAELNVIAPPDPPIDVSFSACMSRSAIVSWTKGFDNFSPITKYYVEYNHSFAPDVWTRAAVVKDPTKTEARVKLSPHANYTFRVIAENLLGKSKPSERSLAACDANSALPDKHPSNVHTDRSRTGWLIIKWDKMPEIEHNGPGFRYDLVIMKNGKKNTTEIYDWTENKKEIYIGSVYEPYEIFVDAVNEIGPCNDPAVVHIGYTGEAAPLTAPGNFELVGNASAKSATFQWDPVDTSPEMIRGEFKGYQIRYWKVGEKNTTMQVVEVPRSPPQDTRIKKRAVKDTATVNSLPPYSDLEADIVAANTYFVSNASNVISFTTPEGVPGRVKKARVVLRGSHHFLVEWEPPEEPNGVLLGFEIGYKKVDGFNVGEILQTNKYDDPYRSRAFIENLDENQEYTIYVWGRTKQGRGKDYYFDAKTANVGSLIVPEIDIVLIGEDFVNVSWSVDPSQDAPAGQYHYVKYREIGKVDFEETEREKMNTWMNVSNLQPNKRYEFLVVAGNEHGETPSDIKEVTTKGEPSPSVKTETNIAQAPWFIIMMILIAVLILILIIVCFIKRSRGEKYNVQEREKLRGNDLENPEKDMFNEYPKSGETDPLAAGSPDSFDNDDHKILGGSETDSMAEYGDVDPSKFNEDGSFIGQYGSQKPDEKGNQQSAMSTFV
ncbi:neuroglian-like isoform X2 [Mercenaria mercenaria]|uniref:neuroglian-like isoform X2 n=1 Tax=Mercenaria mercenaria TaxID=6596 RepID=UPI00234F4721|nr:neuroglian-like isoform X2 [Mercenaria mercenaria]